jgi:hypothetical protein
MFPTIGFFPHQLLSIVGSQININFFFLWHEYLLILRNVVCDQIFYINYFL